MKDDVKKIMRRYDRISHVYDVFESPMELMSLKQWRLDLMKELNGKVLEVGIGTGKNIAYYPENIDITGIDFSQGMLKKARQRAETFGNQVQLLLMDAQSIPMCC